MVETRTGDVRYRVTGREVVGADNVTGLATQAGADRLVLTTCWPLWAGALAPQRLAVFAVPA